MELTIYQLELLIEDLFSVKEVQENFICDKWGFYECLENITQGQKSFLRALALKEPDKTKIVNILKEQFITSEWFK
jgi:hypothetical protein